MFNHVLDRIRQFVSANWVWLVVVAAFGIVANANFPGSVWATAAFACGALLGFLFGVPRVQHGANDAPVEYRVSANTNLEQISDWLTKIIVGVGLVELRQIPSHFESLVRFLAGRDFNPGVAGSILITFGVFGFLVAFLWARLQLGRAFYEADQFQKLAAELHEPPITERGALESRPTDLLPSSPRAAVLTAWEELYEAARDLVARLDTTRRSPTLATSIIERLRELGALDEASARTFAKLREMRYVAAHSMGAVISTGAAADFVTTAKRLTDYLKTWSTEPPTSVPPADTAAQASNGLERPSNPEEPPQG